MLTRRTVAVLLFLVVGMGSHPRAQLGKVPPTQLVITAAASDGGLIYIAGVNFGSAPSVFLSGVPLGGVMVDSAGTLIRALLPPLADGTHLLHVSAGSSSTENGTFNFTVGSVGPTGPQGPPGETGATGPQGPAGSANINGTMNFLTKFTSPTTGGNSLIFDNGAGIGIGTTTPGFPVQVVAGNVSRNVDVQNTTGNGDAIWGVNSAAPGTGGGAGVFGATSQANRLAAGVFGENRHVNGTGVIGTGNNTTSMVLPTGSGGAFSGFNTGLFATSGNPAAGQAILADQFGDQVRVAYWNGSQFFKIQGTGTVSTHVKDPTDPVGERRITLHAPEAPEIYFMDFGMGQLINGRAHVDLDPRLLGNITIDEKHPMRVFIQLEEDENTRGVVVKNKTATGFDVVEIGGGTSNQPFQWQVVANRADEVLEDGRVSKNADARFEEAPGRHKNDDPGSDAGAPGVNDKPGKRKGQQ